MKFPDFWPDGSKIIDNPSQVMEVTAQAKRTKRLDEIQETLRTKSSGMPPQKRKELLAELFRLTEEDELARGGAFELGDSLHVPSQEEKDRMYSLESQSPNDPDRQGSKLV